ncbi:MAG: hypothetical protein AAF235_06125 [Planctomycetota bacterium]
MIRSTLAVLAGTTLAAAPAAAQTVQIDLLIDGASTYQTSDLSGSAMVDIVVSYSGLELMPFFDGGRVTSASGTLVASDNAFGVASMASIGGFQLPGLPDLSPDASYGFDAAQSSLFGAVTAGSPFNAGSFMVTWFGNSVGDSLSWTLSGGSDTIVLGTNSNDFFNANISVGADSIQFNTASIEIVPTPGTAAIIGLGGLVAARRRR